MDENFKKHLQDLAHGHHHPEEHDWPEHGAVKTVGEGGAKPKRAKASATKRKRK